MFLWYNKIIKTQGEGDLSDRELQYQNQITELEQQIRLLKEQVDFLTRKLYGTKSEKTSVLDIEGQMSLFNETEYFAAPNAKENIPASAKN